MCEERLAYHPDRPEEILIPKKIEVGDVIRLKSGGPLMTANKVELWAGPGFYEVEGVWIFEGSPHAATFHEDSLEVVVLPEHDSFEAYEALISQSKP